MHLRYINRLGITKDIKLTGEPISIGRSREADIPLLDDKVSRIHCGIRLSDGEFYLKDLKARNGTFVNGKRVEDTLKLKAGDRIQIGSTIFVLETASSTEDAERAFGSVQDDMGDGKGYSTILKEIVEDMVPPAPAGKPVAEVPAEKAEPKPSHPAIKIFVPPKDEPAAAAAPEDKPAAPGRKKIIIKM